ncbi:cytochrome P450 [Gilvimarinus polysaccharolyticus]|uniref:cytochrome P450 n=1 Tax=Gilvimarinus polysaccharolyticus TaxID=863921 RepID=UPI00067344B6|nr:cytochrome P450 [Gilvimarinus polysaccharolyticus]
MCDKKTTDDFIDHNNLLTHPLETFDDMRQRCPIAHSPDNNLNKGWWAFSHAEVKQVISDEKTFSNIVSTHRSVPNGLDHPEHSRYRKLIEPFFNKAHIKAFTPQCQRIAKRLALTVKNQKNVNVIANMAEQFSVQVQCEFLGWPDDLHEPLRRWAHDNHAATLAGNRPAMDEIAQRFSGYIDTLLTARRANLAQVEDDVTNEILSATVNIEGRQQPISDADIVSIMRNWTMGEIGTIAAAMGIMLHFLAINPALQQHLRDNRQDVPEAIEEMLRRHGPLVTNRRKATRDVTLGGRTIKAGELITVNWVAANRDDGVFADANEFKWGRDQHQSLLYGAGVHVCPGAPLARLELQTMLQAVLDHSGRFTLTKHKKPISAHYPASGYSALWLDFND